MKKKKEVPGREKAETWMRKGVGLMIILDQGQKMELRTKMMMIRQEGMINGWDQHYSGSRSNDDDGGGGSGGGSGGGMYLNLFFIFVLTFGVIRNLLSIVILPRGQMDLCGHIVIQMQ
ncbi:hypothetical protein MKX03_010580 [Papaver bracteatum]|nr:hypothetical protein MKX03_010580 [Papaver bracteatum]